MAMKSERRNGMMELENKVDELMRILIDFRAESSTDRKNMREDIIEIKTHARETNGGVQKTRESLIQACASIATHDIEIGGLRKNLNRVVFIILGGIITMIITKLLGT
jgi:hypothetical protein